MNRKSNQFFDRSTSRLLIFIATLLTIFSFIPISRLKIDFNPLQLLNNNDPDKIYYDQFKSRFNATSEEQSILIALTNRQGVFQKDFLTKVDSLTRFLLRQKPILRVYSLTNANLIYFNGKDVNARPLIHVSQPEFYQQDSIYLFRSKEFRDLLLSENGDDIAIGAFNDTTLTLSQKKHLIESIDSMTMKLKFEGAYINSRFQFEQASLTKWKSTAIICLAGLLTVIIIGFLLLKFPAKEILINLAIILAIITWFLALISLCNYSLNYSTAAIILLLAIITCATLFHYYPANLRETDSFRSFSARVKIICSTLIILLTACSIYFVRNKKTDPHIENSISRNTMPWVNLRFLEDNFFGSRPFELELTMKNNRQSFYDVDIMNKEQQVENFLRDSLQVGAIISPMSLFKGANKAFHNGSIDYFRIPDSSQQIQRFAEAIQQTEYADEIQRYMVADGSSIRISGRMKDVGAIRFNTLFEEFDKHFNKNYSQSFSYKLTGPAIIYDKLIPRLKKLLAITLIIVIAILLLSVINFGQIRLNKNHLEI